MDKFEPSASQSCLLTDHEYAEVPSAWADYKDSLLATELETEDNG